MAVRIAYVCSDSGVPVHGPSGSSVHVRSLVSALNREHAEVELVAQRAGDGTQLDVHEARGGPVARRLSQRRGAARELGKLLASADASRKLERLHRQRPFDLVYERLSLWGTAGLELALKHGLPYFLEVNAPLVDEARRHRGLELEPAASAVEGLLLEAATRVFVVSRPLARHVAAHGAAEDVIRVVPNAVDEAAFRAHEPRPPGDGPLRIGFVGSLKPWHGLPVLLEAFHRLRKRSDARLVVVGDGPLRADLTAAREQLGAEAIDLVGAVEHERIPELLSRLHVATAPYPVRDVYFSPLKVVEAMAAGTCVVASRAGDLEHDIEHGVTGLLVDPGDPQQLADTLLRLSEDRQLAARLGHAAREQVLSTRSWSSVARQVLSELSALSEERHATG